jgi:hypothetical protein
LRAVKSTTTSTIETCERLVVISGRLKQIIFT